LSKIISKLDKIVFVLHQSVINKFHQFTKALFILRPATKFSGRSPRQSNASHRCCLIAVRPWHATCRDAAWGQGQVEGQQQITYTCSEQLLYFVAVRCKLNVAINKFYQFTKALFILRPATKLRGCSHRQSNACHRCRLIAIRGKVAEILLGHACKVRSNTSKR
jgi:hypothetical protein